ncbi:MAG: hypothetical protein ACO2O2_17490 [Acidilobaceae archaeon]
MVNYVFKVVSIYEAWANGRDLTSDEIYEASSLLGSPTRKLEVFLSRFRDVFGQVVEERCCDVGGGRVCIYSWSRRAFKRYFPVALDAGGTVVYYEGGVAKLVSYPLHRAFDLGVRGVELPSESPSITTPRVDGWQVNLYWDPVLNKWVFSTRYVLHNMVFVRGELKVEEYGLTINPIVSVAEALASKIGLYSRLDDFKGWTFTFMIEGSEPATWVKGPPEVSRVDEYKFILVAARKPSGELLNPIDSLKVAEVLGVEGIAMRALELKALEEVRESVDHPSIFLWHLSRGDPEHPEVYEVRSEVYEDYVNAVRGSNAKSYMLLLTSGSSRVVERLRGAIGDNIVLETLQKLGELGEVLEEASRSNPDDLRRLLRAKGLKQDAISTAMKALEEGKPMRVIRILLSSLMEGWSIEDTPLIIANLVEDVRAVARGL